MPGTNYYPQLAEAPTWFVKKLRSKKAKKKLSANGKSMILEGSRNDALASIAGSFHDQGAKGELLFKLVMQVNLESCKPPLTESEVRSIAQSIDRYPILEKDVLISAHTTDDGNALRLQDYAGKNLLFSYELKKYFVWDGNLYRPANHGEEITVATDLIRKLYGVGSTIKEDEARSNFIRNARTLESYSRKKAMMQSAQNLLAVAINKMDTHPFLFNVSNGTIDLKTGRLRPGRREDLMTKRSYVKFDPDATCFVFLKFLDTIFPNDPAMIKYIRKTFGYSLTGCVDEQCFFLFHGDGQNGKSTLLEVLKSLLGEYAVKTRAETFLHRRGESIPNDIAALRGARLITTVEPPMGSRLDESRIKEFTGKDTVSARFLHGEYFEFRPEGKLFIGTNRKPQILGRDLGIWRRVRLIPFDFRIPDKIRIGNMEEILLKELSGILNWVIAGCLMWQAEKLRMPPAVQTATLAYRAEEDSYLRFTHECCKIGKSERVQNKQLRSRYLDWCRENEAAPIPTNEFRPLLEDAGFTPVTNRGYLVWKGIGLC